MIHDWADREAADFMAVCATGGYTTASQYLIAKRLREIAGHAVADHQVGIERAFDTIFPPPAASIPQPSSDAVTPCLGETKVAQAGLSMEAA